MNVLVQGMEVQSREVLVVRIFPLEMLFFYWILNSHFLVLIHFLAGVSVVEEAVIVLAGQKMGRSTATIFLVVLLFIACMDVLVNMHPLLSEWNVLHHKRAALNKEIGAPWRDGARL